MCIFQIKESPEGDWNCRSEMPLELTLSFKLKNPRKGTETMNAHKLILQDLDFQIKESPEGDWNA